MASISTTVSDTIKQWIVQLAALNNLSQSATTYEMLADLYEYVTGEHLEMPQRLLKVGYRPTAAIPPAPVSVELVRLPASTSGNAHLYHYKNGAWLTLTPPLIRSWQGLAVSPVNPAHWAMWSDANNVSGVLLGSDSQPTLWQTTDAGATWTSVTLALPSNYDTFEGPLFATYSTPSGDLCAALKTTRAFESVTGGRFFVWRGTTLAYQSAEATYNYMEITGLAAGADNDLILSGAFAGSSAPAQSQVVVIPASGSAYQVGSTYTDIYLGSLIVNATTRAAIARNASAYGTHALIAATSDYRASMFATQATNYDVGFLAQRGTQIVYSTSGATGQAYLVTGGSESAYVNPAPALQSDARGLVLAWAAHPSATYGYTVDDGTTRTGIPNAPDGIDSRLIGYRIITSGGSVALPGDTTGGTGGSGGTGGAGGGPAGSGTLTTTTISGVVGQPLSAQITASITFDTVTVGGTLPAGLSISAGGLVTGTATTAGTTALPVTVSDSIGGAAASGAIQIVIAPPTAPDPPPPIPVGAAFTFTPAEITKNDPEIGRWMGGLRSGSTVSGVPARENTDRYDWKDLETAPGVYDFSQIDSEIDADWAAGRRREIRVRWMHSKTSTTRYYPADLPGTQYGGGWWLHIRNSTVQTRFQALLTALHSHLSSTGRLAKISRIAANAGGQWGEGYYISGLPTDATPDTATMQAYAAMYTGTFAPEQLVSMTDQVDFLAAMLNASPLIGMRRDSLGITTDFNKFLPKHTAAMQATITGRWQTAPFISEWYGGGMDQATFLSQGSADIDRWHLTTVQNGNIPFSLTTDQQNTLKALGRKAGARLWISKLETGPLTHGQAAIFTAYLQNNGNAPHYDAHSLRYALRATPTGPNLWTQTGPSLQGILPTNSVPVVRQTTTAALPAAGTYYLVVEATHATLPNDRLTQQGAVTGDVYVLGQVVIA